MVSTVGLGPVGELGVRFCNDRLFLRLVITRAHFNGPWSVAIALVHGGHIVGVGVVRTCSEVGLVCQIRCCKSRFVDLPTSLAVHPDVGVGLNAGGGYWLCKAEVLKELIIS